VSGSSINLYQSLKVKNKKTKMAALAIWSSYLYIVQSKSMYRSSDCITTYDLMKGD
jgi:hypothetical protein